MMRNEGGGNTELLGHFIHRRWFIPAGQDDLKARGVAHQPKSFSQFNHQIITNPKTPPHGIIAAVSARTWRRHVGFRKA
jgi:hypothetical protein